MEITLETTGHQPSRSPSLSQKPLSVKPASFCFSLGNFRWIALISTGFFYRADGERKPLPHVLKPYATKFSSVLKSQKSCFLKKSQGMIDSLMFQSFLGTQYEQDYSSKIKKI